jgi:hypothetical protein
MLLQFCASLVLCSMETKSGIKDAAAVLHIHWYSLKTPETVLFGSVILKYSGVF